MPTTESPTCPAVATPVDPTLERALAVVRIIRLAWRSPVRPADQLARDYRQATRAVTLAAEDNDEGALEIVTRLERRYSHAGD